MFVRNLFWCVTGFFAFAALDANRGRTSSSVSTQEKEEQTSVASVSATTTTTTTSAITTHSISVVLPAYNEEAVIEQTIAHVCDTLEVWVDDFELLIVNDGSQDRTAEIVRDLAQQNARVRLLNHEENQGYGAALVTGFRAVEKELAFFMDADGQFDISDLKLFFPLINYYDGVFGYRNPRRDPWIRKCNAWLWKRLAHLVFGIKVRDIDCAFKLYRAEFFQTLELETRGAMINIEMLYKFARAGYAYTEVGVRHLPRKGGQATGAKPTVILRALRELFFYAWKWHREEQEQRH